MGFGRRSSRPVMVRHVKIGGGAPVSIQSMTKTDTRDVPATIEQIRELEEAGCDIVRLAVPDEEAARALRKIREATDVPLVADIHFDYRLAIAAIRAGVDKLRINPGNIGGREKITEVARAAADAGIPIRVGVNSGSIRRELIAKYGGPVAPALLESARESIDILEDAGFRDLVLSLKAASPQVTIEAYRLAAKEFDLPLHIGLTESGSPRYGIVKSSVVIGTLLAEGIGDTIRVSLTAPPVEEVRIGRAILNSLGLGRPALDVVSCPTCGRCRVDLARIVKDFEERVGDLKDLPLKVAIMGCEVNGPGEARDADVGLAMGDGYGLIFVHGKPVRKVSAGEALDALLSEIRGLGRRTDEGSGDNSRI